MVILSDSDTLIQSYSDTVHGWIGNASSLVLVVIIAAVTVLILLLTIQIGWSVSFYTVTGQGFAAESGATVQRTNESVTAHRAEKLQ